MKVKMLECRSGASGVDKAGDVIDIDAEEGGRMIAAGQAELYKETKKVEKATAVKTKKAK